MKKLIGLLAIALMLCVVSTATAALLNTRPVSPLGSDPSEPTLDTILNGGGSFFNWSVDVIADQVPYAYFSPTYDAGAGDISAMLYFEYSGLDDTNAFGIYSLLDHDKKLEIFKGSASPIGSKIVTWIGTDVYLNYGEATEIEAEDFGLNFGYYLQRGDLDNYYNYSEDSLNPGGLAQMLIYQKPGTTNVWAIGCEDLIRAGNDPYGAPSDNDFQDLVVRVSEANPAVPEPATLLLVGGGLLGLAGFRRKFKK